MKTKVLMMPLLFVALSCGEPNREQIRERIDQSILSHLNNWLSLKNEVMYEVKTTDFKLIDATGSPLSGFKGNTSQEHTLYFTTTIVTKTVDSSIVQDTIHCTLDRSFNVIASTDLSTSKPYP